VSSDYYMSIKTNSNKAQLKTFVHERVPGLMKGGKQNAENLVNNMIRTLKDKGVSVFQNREVTKLTVLLIWWAFIQEFKLSCFKSVHMSHTFCALVILKNSYINISVQLVPTVNALCDFLEIVK